MIYSRYYICPYDACTKISKSSNWGVNVTYILRFNEILDRSLPQDELIVNAVPVTVVYAA